MFLTLSILGFSFNMVLCLSQPFLTQIGLEILLIISPLLVIWFILAPILSHGVLRSKTLCLTPPLNQSTELLPLLPLSFVRFVKCCEILVSSFPFHQSFGVTTFLPLPLLPILSFMPIPSMLKWIITLFENEFFIMTFKFVTLQLVINWQTFLLRVSLLLVFNFYLPKPWCYLTPWF